MKNSLLLLILLCLWASCSQKRKVDYVVPANLKDQPEAVAVIDEMAEAVGECQAAMQKAVKFAISVEKNNTDSLSVGQGIKGAFAVSKVMLAKKHIDEAKDRAAVLSQELSVKQILALDSVIKQMESQIGDINTDELGLSEEELARLKAGGNLEFGSMLDQTPQSQAAKDSIEAEAKYIQEQHRLHDEWMKSQGVSHETSSSSKGIETPMWVGIAFPIIVLGLIIVFFVVKLRRFMKGIKRVAGEVEYVKTKLKNKNY